ncbi:MAG: putative glutamine amidotransferase [Frankiales bacterium]|jgi:GMP synthase-like glutamine amidotransferase|nr:putative glutamine amidotransferase [Frankiales bacterium]
MAERTYRALVVTHEESGPVGTFGDWFPAAGIELDLLEPWRGDALPERVDAHDALIVLGGSQQAYDDRSAPWLRATKDLLRAALADDVPVLGICLGGQLLAEAAGGRVAPGAEGPEIGPRLIAKRDAAGDDPLFERIPLSPMVIQWHWDAIVDLPPGAVLLAASPRYPHQAFRVGQKAYGLQFHIETPPELVVAWAAADAEALRELGFDPVTVVERSVDVLPEIEEVWRPFVERFAALVRGETRTYLPIVG